MGEISVCIATYNGEKFIYDQLQSILENTAKELGWIQDATKDTADK